MAAPRKVKAVVIEVKHYKDYVTWFRLRPEIHCRFKPGQFLHLALDSYDPSFNWPESRVFSIASSPERKDCIDILVSPKGAFTNRMIHEMVPGKEVWLKLPFGDFNFNADLNADVVLVAGGTGISPFIGYLEKMFDSAPNFNQLHLYYGVRDEALIIYNQLLIECSKKIQEFYLHLFIENGAKEINFNSKIGKLPIAKIVTETKYFAKPMYYLSGPQRMINEFDYELKSNLIPETQVFFDKWD